jgi:hypothetical protein
MNKQKLLIGVVLLVVLVLGGYMYFSSSKSTTEPTPSSTLVSSNNGSNPVALGDSRATDIVANTSRQNEIAELLKNVNQIKLDTKILQNPLFLALLDTSLTLPDTAVSGRINPFARSGALDAASPVTTDINASTADSASTTSSTATSGTSTGSTTSSATATSSGKSVTTPGKSQ